MNWSNKNILILGLGSSGLSAARWLTRHGAQVAVADQASAPAAARQLQDSLPDVKLWLGQWPEEAFSGIDAIVISPGVPDNQPQIVAARSRGVAVISDVEVFARAIPPHARVVAITGSNGKSTVTTMVGEICKAAGLKTRVAGNIGLPALDALDEPEQTEVYVLELSSFQLEHIESLHCAASVVLNLSEDHLDRYPDMQAYANAKGRVYVMTGLQVVNREDPMAAALAIAHGRQVSFGLDCPQGDQDYGVCDGELRRGRHTLMQSADLRVAGSHNVANALAAWALAAELAIPDERIAECLKLFGGLPHRVQWVAGQAGIDFYDDSKGTNVGATVAAMRGLSRPLVLIAGGDGKGQDFTPLSAVVRQKARAVVLIGRDADKIAAAIADAGVPVIRAATMEEAVRVAREQARAGDAVLLSPACASFDMFDNYAHRARVFVSAVERLAREVA